MTLAKTILITNRWPVSDSNPVTALRALYACQCTTNTVDARKVCIQKKEQHKHHVTVIWELRYSSFNISKRT